MRNVDNQKNGSQKKLEIPALNYSNVQINMAIFGTSSGNHYI